MRVGEDINDCEPSPDESFTVKTEKHEPCRFSSIAVRRDAVYVFLMWLQNHEIEMHQDMSNKRSLVMTPRLAKTQESN